MMHNRYPFLGLTLMVLAMASVVQADNLATLFPLRTTITTDNPGLNRLELPADIIRPCRSDMADLRILDSSGREIPYLLDSPIPSDSALEMRHTTTPEIISAKRSRNAVDARVTRFREDFILAIPPLPEGMAAWDLVVTVGRPEFVSRATITGFGPESQKKALLEDGSFFRIPGSGAEKNRFTITNPRISKLELVLEGLDQGYLNPRFTLEARRRLPRFGSRGAELEIIDIRQLPTRTEVVISRPRGLVPRRLRLMTTTGTFHREIAVWDEGPGADPEALGSKAVLRIDAIVPVEDVEIPVRPARGDRLRIVIDNQDSPPLDSLRMTALVPRPVLIFSLPRGDTQATLVFGGGRAHRPRYDLFSLEDRNDLPATGAAATRAMALLDPSQAGVARLGPIEPNPQYDAKPALSFAMHPGASIDPRFYSHRRHIEAQPSSEGLIGIEIDPGDLAVLRTDLADLRIVDGKSRQWAYLRQDHSRTIDLPLKQISHRVKDRWSHFIFEVPDPPLTINHLQILTDAAFFDRDFRIRATLEDGHERDLAQGHLHRSLGDPRPVRLHCPPTRITTFELIVNDGDDAPLDLRSVNARIPVPTLYLAAPSGAYDLLMGYPEANQPHYELENIRSTVLAVPAGTVSSGPLEANPLYSAGRRLSEAANLQKILLWAVLALAVIILFVMTLRMARQEQE